MNQFYLVIGCCLLSIDTFSQVVNNVFVKQDQNAILISYNLETYASCEIRLFFSQDNGQNWIGPLKQVKGAVGANIPSGSHTIIWNVLDEYSELKGDNIKFKVEGSEDSKNEKVWELVDDPPSFPGGENKLMEYLGKSIVYPTMAKDHNISGRVYITFLIDKTGKISEPKVLRGIGGGCDEEALRVIKGMPPWLPGRQNGIPVSVQYNLPIVFNLY